MSVATDNALFFSPGTGLSSSGLAFVVCAVLFVLLIAGAAALKLKKWDILKLCKTFFLYSEYTAVQFSSRVNIIHWSLLFSLSSRQKKSCSRQEGVCWAFAFLTVVCFLFLNFQICKHYIYIYKKTWLKLNAAIKIHFPQVVLKTQSAMYWKPAVWLTFLV